MNRFRLSCLFVFILLSVMATGCMIQRESAPQLPCAGQEPLIGAWLYDPAGRGDAVFLYIFKDYGRYDAVALPRVETSPLTYELWVTGSWMKAAEYTYNVTGQVLLHDFTTEDLMEGPNNETLTYNPTRDILFNKNHPEGIFTRISCVPQIPEGMNATIPFD